MSEVRLDDIVSLAKRRGFIYQGSEIYGGLSGTWDYGPLGVMLKRNISNLWWKMFVENRVDMFGLESAILMNPQVWEASGHLDTFTDPLIECNNCKARFRADQIDQSKCPVCGKGNTFSEARQFNMMFKTNVGPVEDESSVAYLRPETAQGMFVNFRNILDSFYPDIPFGIAQIGRNFRNEISPRDFIFRVREFEIMELEYFIHPETWETNFENWREFTHTWFEALGLPAEKIHEVEVSEEDRAHYSKRTIDFEFAFPFGNKEIAGLAYRTDFDLSNHEKHSGRNFKYLPKGGGDPFLPHVIEPTYGLDRHVLAVIANAYTEDEINDEKRVFLKLPEHLAPIKYAVSPLLKNKPELVEKATEVFQKLKAKHGLVMWDDNGNIGKRYRRQDEIGTPNCVVIDFQTLEDNTVTIRNRDTTEQIRQRIDELTQ